MYQQTQQKQQPIFADSRTNTSISRKDPSFLEYFTVYMPQFDRLDWIKYIAWIGMMLSLGIAMIVFLLIGNANGANYPSYVWLLPIGTFGFTFVIAFDNIAHSIIYKDEISGSELLIHKFTTASGILSNVFLVLGYKYAEFFYVPILVLIWLSVIYSMIDEIMHWIRYSRGGSGVVEMSAHFGILIFHPIMVFAWLYWYLQGYPGVAETLQAMGLPA